ncbi:MAG: hypothetical protein GKS06_10900 [Acidobacteria bacterium]|nr:hypothetical protein [Acidobacteriota bacterium]
MKTYRTFGPLGLIVLIFGVLAGSITGTWTSFYVLAHVILGGMMLGLYLFTHVDTLRDTVSGRQAKYGTNAVVYTLLTLGVIVAVNYVAAQREWRVDLTEEGIFSLAPQTVQLLESLDGEVMVTGFYREGEGGATGDLLESYRAASALFDFEMVDPDKRPELAEQYEISQYGTLHIAAGEDITRITEVSEEQLTNTLMRLTAAQRRVIYYLTGHGEPDITDSSNVGGMGIAASALENEGYDVRPLALAGLPDVPADADLLMVVAPERPVLEQEIAAIDRFIARGGKTLMMVDPQRGDEFRPLLASRGVTLGDDIVIEQFVQLFAGAQLGVEPIITDYGTHPITAGFSERTIFNMARSITLSAEAPAGIDLQELARTSASPNSWGETDIQRLFESGEVQEDEGDLAGPIVVAAAATIGRDALQWTASAVASAPADAEVVQADLAAGAEAPLDLEGRLVIVGDSEWANNRYIGNFFNRDLFLNAVTWLAGEEEMISIRPRQTRSSSVMLTQQESTAVFYLTVLLLPELVLFGGMFVFLGRRNR